MAKINPIRPIDDDARQLFSDLLAKGRYGAIGVVEPDTSMPLVSRIAFAWSKENGVFMLASDLSNHTICLKENSNCSLLIGDVGKGDGMAHPRVTLIGSAKRLPNDYPKRSQLRELFLKSHPKSELYIDFADFGFYPLTVERAQLNGGFGKAYHFEAADLADYFPA